MTSEQEMEGKTNRRHSMPCDRCANSTSARYTNTVENRHEHIYRTSKLLIGARYELVLEFHSEHLFS